MDIETYLENLQNNESVGGFAIDSLHTRKRTLTDAIEDDDIVVTDDKNKDKP